MAESQPAAGGSLANRPLQVVTACRLRDLAILELATQRLRKLVPFRALCVLAPDKDCQEMRARLGPEVRIVPEDEFIPGMTLGQVRQFKAPAFPRAAGWYFQQFLKLQYALVEPEDDYYLIWDADTVPLRPLRFFDEQGRMLLTRATEHHAPYFETYRRLLGEEPHRECSFIAQHLLVQKSVARELLGRIEQRIAGEGNWAWKILRSLPETGDNLFSEYETYGHYLKNHHRERVVLMERPWLRDGTRWTGGRMPTAKDLEILARDYEFVAFERMDRGWRRIVRAALMRIRGTRF